MSLFYYIGDAGPVPAVVTEPDGVTPATPISATATIVNQHTGEAIITNGACTVSEGLAAYIIPEGSPIMAVSARYVAYIRVVLDATTIATVSVPFDILDKASYLIVDRWRRKVEFAKPNDEAISEEEGRDWIDQAVDYLNSRYATGITSVLASLTTAGDPPSTAEIEFISSTAALMARTAWWAGKGNWRDEEMSLDTSPFAAEWARLEEAISRHAGTNWFTTDSAAENWSMYNRDKINWEGLVDHPDDYFDARWTRDPYPSASWYDV